MKKINFRGGKTAIFCLLLSITGLFLGFGGAKQVYAATKSRFEKLELFTKVLYLVESQYYRKVDVDKLVEGAIKGMISTLDPHSSYLPKKVFRKMQEETKGEFGGLGIEVTQKDGVLVVITPIDDTPAFRAGIKAGDRIVEINNDSLAGLSLEDAVEKMRGKSNSKVTIGVIREGADGIKHFNLKREIIKIKPVESELIDESYVYLRLKQFQKDSGKFLTLALKEARRKASKKKGLKGIVLDLRSNPGGLLDEAVNVSSIFMKDGIVVSTEGRDPKNKEIRYVKKAGHKELTLPLIVLINGSSASASEIVAGAIQDSGRGVIMGAQSFGKGSVQNVVRIDSEKGVKLTIAQYMTPSGKKIQAIGIRPDVVIEDYDAEILAKGQRLSPYVREKDLRNHLTAAIETSKEKIAREKEEKIERLKRIERLKALRKRKLAKGSKKSSKKLGRKKFIASKDYQVLQAINYIKSFNVFKKM